MIWTPKKLTRKQMEERRLKGGRLLKTKRLARSEIARRLGVSQMAVSHWAKRLRSGGLRRLKRRSSSGRPPRLTGQQRRQLLHVLKRGALVAGFPTDRWTLPRIRRVIDQQFAVRYHPAYLSRLLRRWGWSCQHPIERARERDEAEIQAWRQHDWPRIKKKRGESGQKSCFSMNSASPFRNPGNVPGGHRDNRRCCAARPVIVVKSQRRWG